MLGLYDCEGELHVVGHTSGLKAKEKRELVTTLAPYETGDRGSAEPSRWSADRDLEWVALRPELVIEVSFDHVSAGRIRHGAKILRWREDKAPASARSSSSTASTTRARADLGPRTTANRLRTFDRGLLQLRTAVRLRRPRGSAWGNAAAFGHS